jgi:uncharacterized membrane protein YidH (DUF202 family)
MKKTLKVGSVVALMALPMFAFAAPAFSGSPLEAALLFVEEIFGFLVPFFILLAGVLFMWGLVKYVANASDEAAKESAKTLMIWGMVAIFVMVSFWGIIGFFSQTLGLSESVIVVAPPSVNLIPS